MHEQAGTVWSPAAYLTWAGDPDGSDVIEHMDAALQLLDEGLDP